MTKHSSQRMSVRPGAAIAAACLAIVASFAGGPRVAAAGPRLVPLQSPAPGSPVFTSFKNTYEDSLSSTLFDIVAQGSDLAYVWSLQNVTCGTLGQPQTRDPKNAYVHPGCATAAEVPVRVTVLVAKRADLNADGTPKADVAYFTYSQSARATDGDPAMATLPIASALQYFGPVQPIPTTTSRASASAEPSAVAVGGGTATAGGDLPWWIIVIVAIALLGGFFFVRQQGKTAKDPCEEEKARVARAKAAVEAARSRQQRINQLKAANDKAQADLTRAQAEQASATSDKTTSYGEDVATGRRVYVKSDQVRIDRAQAALKAATEAAASAKSAYDAAGDGGEVTQAQYAVEDTLRELGRAEEALARCLQTNAPAQAPVPPVAPPTTPATPPTTPPTTPGTTSGPGIPVGGGGPMTQERKPPKCPPNTYRDAPARSRAPLRVSLADMSSVRPKCLSSDDRDIPWDLIDGAMTYAKNARKGLSFVGDNIGKVSEDIEEAMSPMGPILEFTGTMTDKALEGLQQVIDIYKKKAGSGYYGITFTIEDFELRCIARDRCVNDEWVAAPPRFEVASLGAHEAQRGNAGDERDHVQVVYGSTNTLERQLGGILFRYVNSLKGQNDAAVRRMKEYQNSCK